MGKMCVTDNSTSTLHCALSPNWHSTSATVRWPSPCTPPWALADATQQFLSLGHITTNYCSETSTCWVWGILRILQSFQKCWTLNIWGVSLSKKWWELTDRKAFAFQSLSKQLWHFIKLRWMCHRLSNSHLFGGQIDNTH